MSMVQTMGAQSRGSRRDSGEATVRQASADPMVEMNTTPLIDVMLVLLIMMIITIPPQTHDIKVELPGPIETPIQPDAVKNDLSISANGTLAWNGVAMSDAQVRAMLSTTAAMDPRPELHFIPDAAARYDRVDQVMAMVRKSGVTAFGFVGNEQYRDTF